MTDGIHTCQGEGYSVWATEADIRHWGGNVGCLEGGIRATCGGDHQLQTKRGKLLADVGIEEMVRSGGVLAST